jgi:hypothetical protein
MSPLGISCVKVGPVGSGASKGGAAVIEAGSLFCSCATAFIKNGKTTREKREIFISDEIDWGFVRNQEALFFPLMT